MTVIGFAGDGDAYGEGLAHLMFAAKRNIDITIVVHNNRARSYSKSMKNLKMVINEAMKHNGFSFVEVLQPCYTYFNTYQFYNERVYEMEEKPSEEQVMDKMTEWNYGGEGNIPVGIFYRESRPTYDEMMLFVSPLQVKAAAY